MSVFRQVNAERFTSANETLVSRSTHRLSPGMNPEMDFCLRRFADAQVSNSIKHINQLERRLERKRTHDVESSQYDEAQLVQRKQELIEQFARVLNINNVALNATSETIDKELRQALRDIRNGIETIAQVSSARNDNRENIEEIREAITKIRQQSARVDSELAHLLQLIDCISYHDHLSRLTRWFRQHYGYANELNRMVGKHDSSGDVPALSRHSPVIKAMMDRVQLWKTRRELLKEFIEQMDEDSITGRLIMDSLFRGTDAFTSRHFLQSYAAERQARHHSRDEHQIHGIQLELERERRDQQARVIQLITALAQLSLNTNNEFQLNKKLKYILRPVDQSKDIAPLFIDRQTDSAKCSLILRLQADHRRWTSTKHSIATQFCFDLCKAMQLPADSLKVNRIEQGSVIVHIAAQPTSEGAVGKCLSDLTFTHSSSLSFVQAIEYCCAKYDCRLHSVVIGDDAFPIEQRFMDFKWETSNSTGALDSFTRIENDPLCPEGWQRIAIEPAETDVRDSSRYQSWPLAYQGSRSFYAPFILTSGMRVSVQHSQISEKQEVLRLSPSIEYCAHPRHTDLWKTTTEGNVYYQLVLQCRVNPVAVGEPTAETVLLQTRRSSTRIDPHLSNDKLEWIVPSATATADFLRENIICCGLLLRRIEGEVKDLPLFKWWNDSRATEF